MAFERGPQGLPDIRKRVSARVALLGAPFRESKRAFSLSEIPDGVAHGSFFVRMIGGISLDTWKINARNGFDWQSAIETHVLYKMPPHHSLESNDEALRWGHRIVNQLVGESDDWPVNLRFKGADVTITLEDSTDGNFILLVVGTPCRHQLSITEVS